MSKTTPSIVQFPDRESIELEAATWVVRQDDRALSAEEKTEFAAWLKASEQHREAYRRLMDVWDDAAVLSELGDIADSVEDFDSSGGRSSGGPWVWATASVACLLALLVAGVMFFGVQEPAPSAAQDYVTAVGEQRTLELEDGSVIRINTDTAISVDMARDARRIRLLRGEAFFDVAHDPSRPLSVATPAGIVRALGTSFSTRLTSHQMLEVTVADGRVEVAPPPADASGAPDDAADQSPRRQSIEVSAGSSATYSESLQKIEPVSASELQRRLSWRDGVVVFAGESLRTVVDDVSRYTDIEIRIADASIESIPIGGYFRIGEIDSLFESLELVFGIRAERAAGGEIILAKAE